jgi:hypothetical protein
MSLIILVSLLFSLLALSTSSSKLPAGITSCGDLIINPTLQIREFSIEPSLDLKLGDTIIAKGSAFLQGTILPGFVEYIL